jgi:3-dehydrosphinganine reductase
VPFDRQHVLVTGGSSGIGKAVACQLARQGAHVSILGRDPGRLTAAREAIERLARKSDQKFLALSADVADADALTTAIAKATGELGPPDVLIASAGIVQPGLVRDLPNSSFEESMATNYLGTVYAVKAVLPGMEERRRGHIVLVSSGAGLLGVYGYGSYSPSKFALHGLAQVLRSELKPLGIRVSLVCPPDTDTPMLVAETKIRPSETSLIVGGAKVLQADEVAATILRGIRQNRFVIAPGLEMKALAHLQSFVEPVMRWYMDRVISRARRSRALG